MKYGKKLKIFQMKNYGNVHQERKEKLLKLVKRKYNRKI